MINFYYDGGYITVCGFTDKFAFDEDTTGGLGSSVLDDLVRDGSFSAPGYQNFTFDKSVYATYNAGISQADRRVRYLVTLPEDAHNLAKTFTDGGERTVELFTDHELKNSLGVLMECYNNYGTSIAFKFKENGGIFAAFKVFDDSRFFSPYIAKGDSSIDDMLRNMALFEKTAVRPDGPGGIDRPALATMSRSIATSPITVNKATKYNVSGDAGDAYYYTFTSGVLNDVTKTPYIAYQYLSYASVYTAFKGKPLFQADTMRMRDPSGTGVVEFRPAVGYTSEMYKTSDHPVYDTQKISQTFVRYNGATNLVNEGYNEKTVKVVKEYKTLGYSPGSVQMPSRLFTREEMLNMLQYTTTPLKTMYWSVLQYKNKNVSIVGYENPDLYHGYSVIQTYPVTNLSKQLKDNSGDFSKLDFGDKFTRVISILSACIASFGADNYSQWLTPAPVVSYYGENDGTEIDNAGLFECFYNNQVSDWQPVDPVKPDIPNDDGNGGFNDQDHLGGNGSWNDTSIDAGVGDDPNRDPIYTMPDDIGITGNYAIVKLNNAGMRSLAEQTWTTDGWLKHMLSFGGISRAGDGVVNVKTCFANIPELSDARVASIAGYALQTPIPCKQIQQYTQWKFSPIPIPVYFGSFLDYAPFTEICVELPFAQTLSIPPELVVGKSIEIALRCDVMSDSAFYIITNGDRLIAEVPANIFVQIPFSSSEYTKSGVEGVTDAILGVGNAVTGAVGAASGVTTRGFNWINPERGEFEQTYTRENGDMSGAPGLVSSIAGVGSNITSMQTNRNITQITRGGGPGAIGAMGTKTPIVKISRPYVTIPPRYYELNGCPSGFVKKVGECSGYLEVGQIYGSIPCSTEEYNLIVNQLKGGIFP